MNEPKFIVDAMLGRLARWLRLLGYDTIYMDERNQREITYRSLKENRILLTRNHRLSRRNPLRIIQIEDVHFDKQVRQVIEELSLKLSEDRIFTRCSECNTLVRTVDKTTVRDKVPPYIYETHSDFSMCPKCKKIFWPGTHWELLNKRLEKIKSCRGSIY